ncbi:hypothetical protein I2I11_04195 [Pontibacter sp. 172403-2]|uniref:hypothetical protein n=1 Tax=Pontibacter rufus TaxID=2791028 RepID=UPI0018B00C2B|nr:hypothetical protein [Pontibacter sp. 172403-2]MBF9252485.1 hypothetical protein [Pontibacter sp. 172403-2]
MKSGLQMVADVAMLLKVPEITGIISGSIWQHQRPANSRNEDVVINSLALTNQQLQQGVVNVNIHVPNLKLNLDGATDNTMPDLARMYEIEQAIYPILEACWKDSFHTDIDEPGQPYQDGANWYLNIRVNYYSLQENYQNL